MIESGVDPNFKIGSGPTLLDLAIQGKKKNFPGSEEACKMLLQFGARSSTIALETASGTFGH